MSEVHSSPSVLPGETRGESSFVGPEACTISLRKPNRFRALEEASASVGF